jgi:signal transduction protein with GAF and PtsI domain
MSQLSSPSVADELSDIKDLATDLLHELERAGLDLTTSPYTLTLAIRNVATALLARSERQRGHAVVVKFRVVER